MLSRPILYRVGKPVIPLRMPLTQNPKIRGLPERADFKSFYGSDLGNSNCDISILKYSAI